MAVACGRWMGWGFITVFCTTLRMGRGAGALRGLPAGRLRVPTLPKIPRRAKYMLRALVETTRARLRFLSMWVRRGLGIVQPRTLDPALLEHGLTLVLPGIESESVFTYGMCDGLADGGLR